MNIFVLDELPHKAAQYHCDAHVVKMILESAQLLCTAHHVVGSKSHKEPPRPLYKKTHINHPCSIWLRESTLNYEWLVQLALDLTEEYTYRYEKTHASTPLIKWCYHNYPNLPNTELTKFAQAMPNEYKNENPVTAYRRYYLGEKRGGRLGTWKKRGEPSWWNPQ